MDLSLKKLTSNTTSRKKPDEEGVFLKRMGALLEEGYSIKEALQFLLTIEKGASREWILAIQEGMLSGHSFHEELEKAGFPAKTCSQIYLAAYYGSYGRTITRCGDQLLKELEKKKKLRSLLSYPLLLLAFMLGMLLMMRFLILPHMEVLFTNFASSTEMYASQIVRFIYYSPQIMVGTILLVLSGVFVLKKKLQKRTVIESINFFIKQPFLTQFLKDYWTSFFFQEWGYLFKNGCSFQEIISIMKGEDASKLLQETGQLLAKEMESGKTIHQSLKALPFFHQEGLMVVTHGENLGKLSTEMLVYADYCEKELSDRLEKWMGKLQPLIFSFIALMIIAIYASLMLPIFSLMEGI